MKLNEHVYNQMRSCLKELSDIEFQKRIWVRGEGPEASSYVEVVCQLFDDTGLGDLLENNGNRIVFSESLDKILREIKYLLNSIDYRIGDSRILDDENWPKVVELSSNALLILEKKIQEGQV